MDGEARFIAQRARRATRYDVLDMVRIAQRAYADWEVDWGHVSAWLCANIERPEIFGCVAEGAASIAMSHEWFWRPETPEINVLFVAGMDNIWGVVTCLRMTAAWGRSLGADCMKIDAETGIDLAPLVKRLGAPFKKVPAYTVRLK